MKVLVGYDGSDGGHDAVELARWISAGARGEALLVNVQPHPGPLPLAYYLLGYDEVPWAEEFFRQPAAALAPLRVRWQNYVGGSPAHVLSDLADQEQSDLVVVGSPHRGAVGRAILGSVASGVLHGSSAPVAVAPRGYGAEHHEAPRTIAVAYDGSPESDAALEQAKSLARRHGAGLELLTVATEAPPNPSLVGFRFGPMRAPADVLEQGLGAVGEGIEARGRELHAGSVATGLAEACDGVHLLVAGSRGYGMLGRVMVGSVATELLHAAPCPVLVVPRPGQDEES